MALYLLTFSLPLPLDIGLLTLGCLGGYAALRTTPRFPAGTLIALALLTAMLILGNVVSTDHQRSLRLSMGLLPAGAVYLLICGYFRSRDLSTLGHVMPWFTLGMGGWLLAVAALHPTLSPSRWITIAGLTAFRVPNDVVLFSILLPFSLSLLYLRPHSAVKAIAWSAIAVTSMVAVVYRSRLAILVILTTAALFLGAMHERGRLGKIAMPLVMVMVAADAMTGFALLDKLRHPVTATTRLPLWLAAWRMFLDSPWIGHGIGSFRLLYRNYLHPLPEWAVVDSRLTPWAHNLYLELLAELGMSAIPVFAVFSIFPLRARRAGYAAGEAQKTAAAGLSALAGLCISGFFELSLWRQWVGLTFLFLVACMACINRHVDGGSEQ